MSETSKNPEIMGVDPTLKEEINKEGWEDYPGYAKVEGGDENPGAAVFVGKKEEVEKAREIMETEGKAENVDAYIRMHKVVKVRDYMIPAEIELGIIHPGKAWLQRNYGDKPDRLIFIDEDSNIAEVEISIHDIASLKESFGSNLEGKLEDLGFDVEQVSSPEDSKEYFWVLQEIKKQQEKLNKEAQERKKGNFNF